MPNQPQVKKNTKTFLFLFIVVLSGMAGLGYQIIWSQLLAVALGHEIIAVLGVIAAFFFGLGLGSYCLNKRVLKSGKSQNFYAFLELLIALWAIVLIWMVPCYHRVIPQIIGLSPTSLWHWLVAFVSSLLLFLPSTFAMGATLPLMEKILSCFQFKTNRISGLYALNTFGAVLGTLLTAYYLIPALGLAKSSYLFAGVNLVCALGTVTLFAGQEQNKQGGVTDHPQQGFKLGRAHLLVMLFISGLLGLGYEVLIIRVLSQVLENTVYTFAVVLSIYLLGTVNGAAIYQSTWARRSSTRDLWYQRLSFLLITTSTCCLLGIGSLWLGESFYRELKQLLQVYQIPVFLAELLVAALVFLLPTIAMGALFSHIAQQTVDTTGLGKALCVNTMGAMLAPLVFGVVLLPALGAKIALSITSLGYLLLLPGYFSKYFYYAVVPGLIGLALLLSPTPLRFINVAPGDEIIAWREGVMASVAVVQDSQGHRHLKVDNHFTMGGTASRYSDYRQTHLPLLFHGSPKSVLYLGLGTGVTFQAARYHPQLKATGVELIPETLDMMHHFDVNPGDAGWPVKPDLYAADARRFVLTDRNTYDVIIAEIFHPSRDGAGSLYTREHFSLVKNHLQPGGVFCQWLPLFQLDLSTLKLIIRTFLEVFPRAELHLGHFSLKQPILCLLGSEDKALYSDDWLLDRVFDKKLQQQLITLRLNSDHTLFGGLLADTKMLQNFSQSGPINTDDQTLVSYRAPDFVYSQQAEPARRLLSLLDALGTRDQHSLFADDKQTQQLASELGAYWQARDIFLQAGRNVSINDDVVSIVKKSQSSLLEAVHLSPHFTPAYRSLIGLAQGLYEVDKQACFVLLTRLINANPEQPGAAQLRRQLYGY